MSPICLLALLSLACIVTLVQSKRPNIIYIMTDDQGYADVSWAKNPTIPTPNLDQLRRGGTELLQFYTNQKCTASRAALMTGKYAHKMGVHRNRVFDRYNNTTMEPFLQMMPSFLKRKSYRTHIVGKWHLGFCAKAATPTYKGFDTFFGSFSGTDNHFTQRTLGYYDWNWHRNGRLETYWPANNTYDTYLITDHTTKLLREHYKNRRTARNPIFIYVSYVAPHVPTQAPPECINNRMCKKIRGDPVRKIYCGMVKCVDDGVGKIVRTLKSLKALDDTIIIFHSDNGATLRGGASSWPLRGSKTTLYEGGTRSRAFIYAPKLLAKAPKRYDGLIHITDMLPTLYAAAKGKASALPNDLDGINMWNEIRNNKPSKREWMIYNINSVDKMHAIRFRNATHDFKLLFKNGKRCPGWQRDPRPLKQRTDGRKKSVPCPADGFRLFNLRTNPNELEPPYAPDAALKNRDVMAMMKAKLRRLKSQEAPIPIYTRVPKDGPGRPWNNDGAFGVGDCEYNTDIARKKQ